MSAYVISDATINLIAGIYAQKCMYISDDEMRLNEAQRAAQILIDENYRSVNHRYREEGEPHKQTFNAKWLGAFEKFSAVELLKACGCFCYQACETEDFEKSDAFNIVIQVRCRIEDKLPGYEAAPWGIESHDKRLVGIA